MRRLIERASSPQITVGLKISKTGKGGTEKKFRTFLENKI
jgi:hypothetical protein